MKSLKGQFTPTNPGKYQGKTLPIWRSTWELSFMRMCDTHPNVVSWVNEGIRIPYINPITGKNTVYVPDFIIEYVDSQGRKHAEMIEIKPAKQTYVGEARSGNDKAALVVNMAKWKAAQSFCSKHGLKFRVLTENDIFQSYGKKKKT